MRSGRDARGTPEILVVFKLGSGYIGACSLYPCFLNRLLLANQSLINQWMNQSLLQLVVSSAIQELSVSQRPWPFGIGVFISSVQLPCPVAAVSQGATGMGLDPGEAPQKLCLELCLRVTEGGTTVNAASSGCAAELRLAAAAQCLQPAWLLPCFKVQITTSFYLTSHLIALQK